MAPGAGNSLANAQNPGAGGAATGIIANPGNGAQNVHSKTVQRILGGTPLSFMTEGREAPQGPATNQ